MTISIHPARKMDAQVPPGTWEETKQDAVLATAQLLEVLSRKKTGEKSDFGLSEYDSQMANAQLRAFKLTKVILRKSSRDSDSSTEVPIMIQEMGFDTPAIPKTATPPPTEPLPTPPITSPNREKSRSPSGRKMKSQSPVRSLTPVSLRSSGTPPPIPPRKSSNRNSQVLPSALVVPPTLSVSPPRFMDDVSPRTTVAPAVSGSPRATSRASPRRQSTSPAPLSPIPRRQMSLPPVAEHDALPVQPFRRVRFGSDSSSDCSDSLVPESSPVISPLSVTAPLVPKRGSMHRSISFRFGEGIQKNTLSRTSSMICSELSDALKDLQRTIGAVEVH
jgi:hypothetical protein